VWLNINNLIKSNQLNQLNQMKQTKTTEAPESNLAPANALDLSVLPDFTGDEYVDRKAKIPRITPLRGELDPSVFGLFVKIDDAIDVELSIPEGMEPIIYTYNNGDKAEGYMFQRDFGMCVLPMSPLLAFLRNPDPGSTVLPEPYEASLHKGNASYSAGRVYNVLLVSHGALLHERPFQMILKGAASASFAKAWEADTIATGKLYALAKGKTYRPMNFEFNRLVVYHPVIVRDLAGEVQKSAALTFQLAPNERPLADRLMIKEHKLVSSALVPLAPQPGQPLMLAEMADDMPF
jgi:Family of unknown function (DUF5895)